MRTVAPRCGWNAAEVYTLCRGSHIACTGLTDTILHSDDIALHEAWIDDEPVRGPIASDHAAVSAVVSLDAEP